MSSLRTVISIVAVLLVGLIAGLMLGTGMDQFTHRLLTASAWVTEHQVMDALFRRVLPVFWNLTALMLIAAAIVHRGPARWLFGIAAALLLISLVVTVRIEVPMNRQIALWDAAMPPGDWAVVRDHWLSFHLVRTVAGIIAFLLATLGLAKGRELRAR